MRIKYYFLFIAGTLSCAAQPAPQQEVKKGSIEGVVLAETTKEPVRRVQVMLYPRQTTPAPGVMMGPPQAINATTDAEGKFSISDLEPGDYFLNLQKQGFTVSRRSAFASSTQLKVGPGEAVKGLKYSLLPQAVIAGRVLDEEGEPVQGANVQALAQQAMRGKKRWMANAQGVQTNDRGEFRLANLAPGKVILQVSASFQPMVAQQATRPGQQATGYAQTFYPGVTEVSQATQVQVAAHAGAGGGGRGADRLRRPAQKGVGLRPPGQGDGDRRIAGKRLLREPDAAGRAGRGHGGDGRGVPLVQSEG
jgi:hypothetical protein